MQSKDITTLCLEAALNIHKDISMDEAMGGYDGGFYAMKKLLEELHTVWHEHPTTLGNAYELEEAWYDAQLAGIF